MPRVAWKAAVAGRGHHDDVGLRHRLPGLLGHLLEDAAGRIGLKATSVNDDVFASPQTGIAVVAITRQPGVVGHDGVA